MRNKQHKGKSTKESFAWLGAKRSREQKQTRQLFRPIPTTPAPLPLPEANQLGR